MLGTKSPEKLPSEVDLEIDGVLFSLRLYDDPSGLRGQVFYGEEKIAGVQVFHQKSIERLKTLATADAAVKRAVLRIKEA
jgi:hypothetical protein